MGEAAPSRGRGLELFGVSVTRLSRDEIIVEEVEEILECGPLLRIGVPTVCHALINGVRTLVALGFRHAAPFLDVLNHLPVGHTCGQTSLCESKVLKTLTLSTRLCSP